MKRVIKSKLASLARRLSGTNDNVPARSPFPFIQNINRDLNNPEQPKALISYITAPFEKNIDEKSFHTNLKEAIQILQVFIRNNYAVDICHCLEQTAIKDIKKKNYDLIFGFGQAFVEACNANLSAVKIIYCTEAFPDFVKAKEQERLSYYKQRYGKEINVSRHGKFYLPEHFLPANFLLFKGNKETEKTFLHLKNIRKFFGIAPAPFLNTNYKFTERNIAETKKNFVWFGSYGAVHKGLDILIDIFNKHADWRLTICGLWKEEIELLPTMNPNSSINGFMDTTSDEFIDLVNTHSFVVLPTCSEGMSSGVLTCMVHGLIPLVSKESGIDLNNEKQYFKDYHSEIIEETLDYWIALDEDKIKNLHHETFEDSRKKYNLGVFTSTFEKYLHHCISNDDKR